MQDELYRRSDKKNLIRLRETAPEYFKAFVEFDKTVMADGAIPRKMKELIAVAVAHTTQCPYCIDIHTKQAKEAGASEREIVEAIWVASALRAGGAFAHSWIALTSYGEQ